MVKYIRKDNKKEKDYENIFEDGKLNPQKVAQSYRNDPTHEIASSSHKLSAMSCIKNVSFQDLLSEVRDKKSWLISAFTFLCQCLEEYFIPIENEYYEKLVAYNTFLGLSKSRIDPLKKLLTSEKQAGDRKIQLITLLHLIDDLKDKLPQNLINTLKREVYYVNAELTFEYLCRSLIGFCVSITIEYYNRLSAFSRILNLDETQISKVKKLINLERKSESVDFQKRRERLFNLLNEKKEEIIPDVYKQISKNIEQNNFEIAFEQLYKYLTENCISITNDYSERMVEYNFLLNRAENVIPALKSLTKIVFLKKLVDEIKTQISQQDLKDIDDYIVVNQWKSAFEALCATLQSTKNITFSQKFYGQLLEYAELVHIPESALRTLSNLISPIFVNGLEMKIGCEGIILNGEYKNWFVRLEDDIENSGGYLIFIFKNRDPEAEGYDIWTEDKHSLIEMLKGFDWEIKWLD